MTTRLGSGISLFRSVFSRWTEKSTSWRPLQYQGMDRFDARKKIISDLEGQGLLVETKPHKLMVRAATEPHAVIEPMLTDQWYVEMEGLAKARAGSGSEWRYQIHAGKLESRLQPMARKHSGLVHFAPIVVGTPDSGLV